jgi:hypothetical protein
MKTQKMSLANIQGKLSRAEMKNIMAGTNSTIEGDQTLGGNCGAKTCITNADCTDPKHGNCKCDTWYDGTKTCLYPD